MNRALHLLLISIFFSSISTLAIYFATVGTANALTLKSILIIGGCSLFFSFIIFYFSYELSIYRRIRNITERVTFLTGRKKDEPQLLVHIPEEKPDPLNELDEEIMHLEEARQQEIEKLKKLENHRKEFLGNVSHELKTPIFNIQGYVSTLIDGGIHDQSINMDYLKRADKSVDRMIRIIDDLEQISQLESGVLEPDFDTYDIVEQMKDIFVSLEMQAFSKKITFGFLELYNSPILVYADKHRIRQVLVNLVTNSIKYGRENGKTVAGFLLKDENEVTIFISDNGIGIEEAHLPRLFERFYRVDKGRSREQGGTGLGLAIVKHIIEAHQQTIKVTSKVGEGTTFSFTLKRG
jgi:two-component system, OmpR family, phosphate regulon sensor histidine kinase PhoR